MDVNKYPYVYLDLDETLIHTRYDYKEFTNKRPDEFVYKLGSYWYGTVLRPCAEKVIRNARRFSIAKILTAASYDYAKLICDHFELGFDGPEEIIARDNYVEFVQDGWGGWMGGARETMVPKLCVNHINSILIDNQTPDMPNARVKREYLGIDEDRYIIFPEWHGGPEEPGFDDELKVILDSIAVMCAEVITDRNIPRASDTKKEEQ